MPELKPVQRQNSSRRARWLLSLVLGLLIAIVVGLIYFGLSWVEGLEFNASTWEIRTFSFRADPFTGYQFSGVQHGSTGYSIDPEIEDRIRQTNDSQPDRWDLAEITQFRSTQFGPASIAADLFLDLSRYGVSAKSNEFWNNWTSEHPERADELWPAIRRLTLLGAYIHIPDVVQVALVHVEDDGKFKDRLHDAMIKALELWVQQNVAIDNSKAARDAAKVGLEYAPDNTQFKAVVDQSLKE